MPKPLILPSLIAACLLASIPARSQVQKPLDWRVLRRYYPHLKSAPDAEMQAIWKQIRNGPRDLAREKEAGKREGLPVAPADLRRPPLPEDRDAAPLYDRLTRVLRDRHMEPEADRLASSLGTRSVLTDEQVSAVRKLLAERKDVMDLVHQAVSRPECRFQRDWSLGPALLFPEYASMREGVRLLHSESYLLARDRRYQEAIQTQQGGFRIGQHAASDPGIIAYLVGIACHSITLAGMEDILYLAGPDAGVDEAVANAIAAHPGRFDLRCALKGEMGAMAVPTFDLLRSPIRKGDRRTFNQRINGFVSSGDQASIEMAPFNERRPFTSQEKKLWLDWVDASEADYRARIRQAAASADKPLADRQAIIKRLEAEIDAHKSNPVMLMNAILYPGLLDHADIGRVIAASREAVLIAGARVLAHKARRGTFPDRIEDMASVPVDPFTGQSLKYRREGDGFVVYSAGPDGKFDGGKPGERQTGDQSLFRYPMPPPRPVPPPRPAPAPTCASMRRSTSRM